MNSTSPPDLASLHRLLADEYGLDAELSRLPGENHNFLVTALDGRRFVFKVAGEGQEADFLDFEHALTEHIAERLPGLAVPRRVGSRSGAGLVAWTESAGTSWSGRLLTFVAGTPWAEAGPSNGARRADLGRTLGHLRHALDRFDHPAAHRQHRWALADTLQHRPKVPWVHDPTRRRLVDDAFHRFAGLVQPYLTELPQAVVHGDANDENVLLEGDRVVGLLDFGDAAYGPAVAELAVAVPYAVLESGDPLTDAAEIVTAYHAVAPLTELELWVLFPAMLGRLAASVTTAAERRRIDPERGNWFVTEERAWALLARWVGLDPAAAAQALAAGTGVPLRWDDGAPPAELVARRHRHVNPALSVAYREPLKILQGRGAYLLDHRGRPFLDLVNNVCHVGHCHPRVVAAGQRQMARLNTNSRYLYDGLTDYAERLCATLPPALDTCFLVNSGSEANELALRLARTHTGRRDVLVVDGAYHGHTSDLIEVSPYKFMGRGGSGRAEPWVHVVPVADGYRGPFKGQGLATGHAYAREVERVMAAAGAPIAAFLSESMLSCGGQVVPPEGYFQAVYAAVRAAGGVCIADEVQVGFGRVGKAFWAFELQGVVPDIVVMGKPIGNGHPLAAVVTTREVAASFANGMEFFATFGGNPVSCAIGLAVLDVIAEEGLQAHALAVGEHFLAGLRELQARHTVIGDVRGEGLFLGFELVRDRETLEPADTEATELVNRLTRRGILLSTDGPLHNVLKIKPPLVITAQDVDRVLRCLDEALVGL